MAQKNFKTTIYTTLGLIVGMLAIWFAFNYNSIMQPSFDKMMINASEELNKQCPFMVDRDTRLDNTMVVNKTMHYNYTLVNYGVSDLDINVLKQTIEPTLINNTKTSPDMKMMRDNNATLEYNYKDKDGVFLFKIAVTPDMYK